MIARLQVVVVVMIVRVQRVVRAVAVMIARLQVVVVVMIVQVQRVVRVGMIAQVRVVQARVVRFVVATIVRSEMRRHVRKLPHNARPMKFTIARAGVNTAKSRCHLRSTLLSNGATMVQL